MNKTEIAAWIELAFHDAATAKLIREHGGYPDIGIYHLYQATEKLLKAAILAGDRVPPKIHALDTLATIAVEAWPEVTALARPINDLDRFLPRLRYPQGASIGDADFQSCLDNYDLISLPLLALLERETGIPPNRSSV